MSKRTPKLPTSVDVAGVRWKVETADLSDDEEQGHAVLSEYKIRIEKDMPFEQQLSTLAHEVAHAATYMSGKSTVLGKQKDEELVLFIEHFIFPAYKKLLFDVYGKPPSA